VELFKVPYDAQGIFLERPNRFLGRVDITSPFEQKDVLIHVHDPGRLPDLLIPGAQVRLKQASNPNRKTGWDLLAAEKGDHWVFVNSAYHRRIVEHILTTQEISPFEHVTEIQPEVRLGKSRLDFCLTLKDGQKVYIETKGCTLALEGRALFPDAPTERGSRHVMELVELRKLGHLAVLFMLVFREDAGCFAPHFKVDAKFSKALEKALDNGVELHSIVIAYRGSALIYQGTIPLCSGAFNQLYKTCR